MGCSKCPPGTYRDALTSPPGMYSCMECPLDTYSAVFGATKCLACKQCQTPNVVQAGELACPFLPILQNCVRAVLFPCSPTYNSECMMCPTLSMQGGYDLRGGVCLPCKNGYFYNASEPVEGKRCVPCTPGFYCPSRERYFQCEGTQIFKRAGQYVTVPTTLAGAVTPSQCNCSLAGGFEPSPFGSQVVMLCKFV